MRWASSMRRQGGLHLFDFIVPDKSFEPLLRATQQPPSVFQMSTRFAEVNAVDRHPSIEDCRPRAEQFAFQLGWSRVHGLRRIGPTCPDPPGEKSNQQPSSYSENETSPSHPHSALSLGLQRHSLVQPEHEDRFRGNLDIASPREHLHLANDPLCAGPLGNNHVDPDAFVTSCSTMAKKV